MTGSDNVRARLTRGALWLTGGRIVTNLLGFISTLVLARLLVPNDFGLVALGTTIFGILASVTSLSMSDALIQHRSPTKEHFNTVWTFNLVRGVIVALIFAALAVPLAHFFEDARLVNVMLALSFSAVLNGVENPRAVMLTRDLVFWQQTMLQVGQKLVSLIVSVTIAIMYQSYWALVFGIVLGQFAAVAISYTILPHRPSFGIRHWRELFSFSIWLTFCQVVTTINWNFDQLLIGKYLGKTSLGYYTVGNNLAVMPTREVTTPLTGTLFPAFSNLAHSPERLAAAYQKAQALVTVVALPAGIGMALIADPFVRLTMGEKWLPAVLIIQCLAAVFAIQTLGSLAQPLAMARGETKLLFKRDLQGFAYRVPLMILGMYLGGLPGIVYMRVLTGTIGIALNTNIVTRITGISLWDQIKANSRGIFASAMMATVLIIINQNFEPGSDMIVNAVHLAVLVGTGAIIYPASIALAWIYMGKPKGPEMEFIGVISRFPGFQFLKV